jgi:hypothetical protein
LPVKVIDFKGKQERTKNILEWKVTQELELSRYEIERQTNTGEFLKIGIVAARGSAALTHYQFVDEQPRRGNHFYRLKMIDRDGSFQYSNVVLLTNKLSSFSYSVYPNPAIHQLYVWFDEAPGTTQQYHVQLLTTTHQVVWQQKHTSVGNNQLQINRPASLPNGMYWLRVQNTATGDQRTDKVLFL